MNSQITNQAFAPKDIKIATEHAAYTVPNISAWQNTGKLPGLDNRRLQAGRRHNHPGQYHIRHRPARQNICNMQNRRRRTRISNPVKIRTENSHIRRVGLGPGHITISHRPSRQLTCMSERSLVKNPEQNHKCTYLCPYAVLSASRQPMISKQTRTRI